MLLLVVTERTGREVAQAFARATGKEISYGTLYTTFRRMADNGWVRVRDDDKDDRRLRWFRITGAGLSAVRKAQAEHGRLGGLTPLPGGAQ